MGLSSEAAVDSAQYFVSAKRDLSRGVRVAHEPMHRDMVKHSERWAISALNAVSEYGAAVADQKIPMNIKYARACISLAERLVHETLRCATLFSGDCVDENDPMASTPERDALAGHRKVAPGSERVFVTPRAGK